jgi:hypothetical protein
MYQTPMDILIKASNGASDFGNKWATVNYRFYSDFEHEEGQTRFRQVIMQAKMELEN